MVKEKGEVVEQQVGRRDILAKIASAVFASLVAPAVLSETAQAATEQQPTQQTPKLPELPPPKPNEDPLIRMMRDLQRALKKPLEKRRWVMVIDLRKCVGCKACTVACIVENKLPPSVVYRPVLEEEIGKYPRVTLRFLPRPCLQCDNPPCTPVCPVKATWKRPDGIVVIDYEACIGCRYCITACPYGARSFDFGDYYTEGTPEIAPVEKAPSFEYHRTWERKGNESPIGNARKCHFCLHRIERGLLPQCVTTCIGRATYFGDANDPESLVSELIDKPNAFRLKEDLGTEPKVYYLI
jgi:Fe-S-cluster-containing dehydrogenase component